MPTLYRTLLRLGRQLDAAPMAKALLIAQPELLFDRRSRELIRLPELRGSAGQSAFVRRLMEFNSGEFYAPETSALVALQRTRHELVQNNAHLVDAGFSALRTLSLAASGGAELEKLHAFHCGKPSLVDEVTRVRATDTLRPGSLLLTHPVACLKQPTLHHAVILLTSVDNDSVSGVVVNKPIDMTLGAGLTDEVRMAVGETLAALPLHTGGDVAERQLLLLHEFPDLADSTAVADGLHVTTNLVEV